MHALETARSAAERGWRGWIGDEGGGDRGGDVRRRRGDVHHEGCLWAPERGVRLVPELREVVLAEEARHLMGGDGRRWEAMGGDGRRWKATEGDGRRWKAMQGSVEGDGRFEVVPTGEVRHLAQQVPRHNQQSAISNQQ